MDAVDRFVCSPGTARLPLEESLRAFSALGYRNMELFSNPSTPSAPDLSGDPAAYRALGARYGMRFTSFHLPSVTDDSVEGIQPAVAAVRFAERLGVEVALYNAATRDLLVATLPRFLNAVEGTPVTITVQNHPGRALETGEDYRYVFAGIGDDPRLKAVLEVGAFYHFGWTWQQGYDLLAERIALVHIKDMVGRQSVPFGTGEVDIPALLAHMEAVGYRGRYVLEMNVADKANTLRYMGEALEYVRAHYPAG